MLSSRDIQRDKLSWNVVSGILGAVEPQQRLISPWEGVEELILGLGLEKHRSLPRRVTEGLRAYCR